MTQGVLVPLHRTSFTPFCIFREIRSDTCRMRQNLPSILAWPLFYLHVLIHDYEALISSQNSSLSWEIIVKRG
jgi:hypothetical protein